MLTNINKSAYLLRIILARYSKYKAAKRGSFDYYQENLAG